MGTVDPARFRPANDRYPGHWRQDEVPAPFSGLVKELGMAPIPEQSGRQLTAYCTGITISLIDKPHKEKTSEAILEGCRQGSLKPG